MSKITLTLPDGSKKEVKQGITGREFAESIGKKLAKDALCIQLDNEIVGLDNPIEKDCKIKILTFDDDKGKYCHRHSTAHVLAHAIYRLYPKSKNTIGPPVEEGFYYDFDDLPIKEEDFPKIEEEMQKLIEKDHKFQKKEITLSEAKKKFKDNKYKTEMAEEYSKAGEKLTTYIHGDFEDLCEGPHITSTAQIGAFKLLKLAGAYWRGDSKNKQLTRIYGISFPTKKQLEDHMKLLEEAERRDHRKIGKEQELFMFHEYSPGSPFFLAKGTIIYHELLNLLREEYKKRDYQEVITPQLFNKKLWETSGHWKHFKDDMFVLKIDDEEASLKPMNCPSHCLIYKNNSRSYKELPLRIADFCFLHRNELRGVLGGLTRDRKFAQDDAHIFCTEKDIQKEITELLGFVNYIYQNIFGLKYEANLSTKPEKAMGDEQTWTKAEESLINALETNKIQYRLKPGEGAFYGPKIDFEIKDSLGRKWQCATIQLDFQMPKNFELTYMAEDGTNKHQPVMIHRAILGSLERFIAILIEHFAGKLPLWLSPTQARLLTINDTHKNYACEIKKEMQEQGIRAQIDDSLESVSKKVRDAQVDKIPLIITIGDKEVSNKTLAIRTLDGQIHFDQKKTDFINKIKTLIEKRSLEIKI